VDFRDYQLALRPAEKTDCRLVYEWRNNPKVRRFFFDPTEIPFGTHKTWFEESLARSDRTILIAQLGDVPVGVIRFDIAENGESAEVDIYIDPQKHGQGLGTQLLETGEQWVTENTRVRALKANVMTANVASIRMFIRCGFRNDVVRLVKELRREGP